MQHWDNIYATKDTTAVSWFEEKPTLSIRLILQATRNKERGQVAIIDVGAGTSSLGACLLEEGLRNATLLDISATAINLAKANMKRAKEICWLVGDVTSYSFLPQSFDVWHDRAVFHFLLDRADRQNYVANAARALRDSGTLIIGTFASDGPIQCSNLHVQR
jgi:SAM-dependent methyltransferase